MTAAAEAITVSKAFGTVRSVAAEIFANFKPTLDTLSPDVRGKECEAAIRYAADVVAAADVSASSHAEVAKRALTECLQRSLRYVAPGSVVEFPGVGASKARADTKPGQRILYLPQATPFAKRPLKAPDSLYGGHYFRQFLNMTVAMPGAGKTTNAITEFLGMAIGYDLAKTNGMRIGKQSKQLITWYVNGEDPQFLIDLRFAAAMQRYGITYGDIAGHLFVDAGRARDVGFVFVADEAGKIVVNDLVVGAVIDEIKNKAIDNLALDPFSAFHRVSENDNTKLFEVMNQLAIVADETRAACELVAHPRKVGAEQLTVDDIRGGSAQHGAIRSLRLGNGMTETQGDKAGLLKGEYRRYFNLVDGKPSLRQWSDAQSWRRMASVEVTLEDDSTTSVGVVERWDWPKAEDAAEAKEKIEREKLKTEIRDTIIGVFVTAHNRRDLRSDKRSPQWAGYAVMPAIGFDVRDKDAKSQVDTWLKLLVKSGELEEREGMGSDRHPAMFLGLSEATRKRLDTSGN